MSGFINTIEVLGDEATMDAIIERTITEFKDDALTKVGPAAFAGCNELAVLEVPNATLFSEFTNLPKLTTVVANKINGYPTNMFSGCKSLNRCEISELTEIGLLFWRDCISLEVLRLTSQTRITFHYNSWFSGCSKLSTLIIDAPGLSTVGSDPLADTPIASGAGYIYVPRALVDQYKSATNWATYADQFRALEDYTVDGTTTGELDESKT